MKNFTHEVLDLVYTPDEGQECFQGTQQECYDFINQQGGATFMYKVVPILNLSKKSLPWVEGKTKSNVKNNNETRRLVPSPPPSKK